MATAYVQNGPHFCARTSISIVWQILVLFQFQGYLHSWVHWAAGSTLSFVRFPKSVLSELFVSHGHHVLPL